MFYMNTAIWIKIISFQLIANSSKFLIIHPPHHLHRYRLHFYKLSIFYFYF